MKRIGICLMALMAATVSRAEITLPDIFSDNMPVGYPKYKAVRYCFHNFAIGSVHNHLGLPLVPFRTDNWVE